MARITKHAQKRAKERCGINDRAIDRMANKVLEQGVMHKECNGQLRKWIDGMLRYGVANDIRLYGDKAYLFRENTLITIIQIPHRLIKQAEFTQKRIRKRRAEYTA